MHDIHYKDIVAQTLDSDQVKDWYRTQATTPPPQRDSMDISDVLLVSSATGTAVRFPSCLRAVLQGRAQR